MLVLTRGEGERIIVGNDIVITVTGFKHGPIRAMIGVNAPPGVAIDREEVRISKDRERHESRGTPQGRPRT